MLSDASFAERQSELKKTNQTSNRPNYADNRDTIQW